MREYLRRQFENPIRMLALVCVTATSIYFGILAYWLIEILASPDWCGKALQAERITPGATFVGLTACIDLLKMQLGALSKTLLIVIGTFALCLGVLVVIVLAGARLAGKLFGGEVDVSRQDQPSPEAAAQTTADAAQAQADEIMEQAGGPDAKV